MLTYLTHLPFAYLPVAPVFLSPFSTTPVLQRLTQISPYRLSHSPSAYLDILLFSSQRAKAAFLISLLTGRVLLRARALFRCFLFPFQGGLRPIHRLTLHCWSTHPPPSGRFFSQCLYSAVPYSGGLVWIERGGATHSLPSGLGSADQSPDGNL